MSREKFRCGPLFGMALWSAVSGSVWAAETQPVPEAIEKVWREFESTKSSRYQPVQPRSGLSAGSFPDWHGTAPEAPVRNPPNRLPVRDTQSKNWLVEVMARQSAEGNARNSTGAPAEARASSPASTSGALEKWKASEASKSPGDFRVNIKESSPAMLPAPNPFSKYLGDWLSPADLALLQPAATVEQNLRDRIRTSGSYAAGRANSPTDLSRVLLGEGDARGGDRISLAAPPPRENPYVQVLAPIPAVSAEIKPTQPVKSASTPMIATPEASAVPTAAVKPPDFAKPTDDEKYFKQLKRF